ncbi:MAG: MFS transporter [Thaumarchaeota archaeon]|nr:MFS transporter [Nitrososphaerota archaeon]
MERKNIVLFVILASMISFVLSSLDYPPISKLVSSQLQLSNSQSGLITSVYFIPYASMQIPSGFLADRYGAGKTLLAGSFVMALAPFLFIAGGNYDAILLSRAIAGASGGMVFPSSVRLISSWFPKNELSGAMSFFGTANGAGQLVASFLLPLLILGINWRPPLIFTILISLLTSALAILPARWHTKLDMTLMRNQTFSIRGIFTRNMFALMLPNFASLAVIFGVFAWSSIFLTTTLHISNSLAGAVVALIGVATIVGSFLGGVSDRRLGSRITLGVSMILLMVFTVLFSFTDSILFAILSILGIGFGANLYFAPDFSLIPYASKQGILSAGATFGVFNTLSNLGSVISPVLFGVILDWSGSFRIGYGVLAAFASLGIIGTALISLKSLNYPSQ